MKYLLDTSAFLAFILLENGCEIVQSLFADPDTSVGISALSLYESEIRLRHIGIPPPECRRILDANLQLLDTVHPADEGVARAAIALRNQATVRVATVDLLIAATASVHGATLVHRDAHFSAIPAEHLSQLVLPEK